MTRIMALDLGERRVGVAISDPLEITAQPFAVIDRGGNMLAEIRAIADEYEIGEVVVGLPLQMRGSEGDAASAARQEADRIRDSLDVPVVLWDERLTTATAERALIDQGVKRRKRREVIDKIAAAVILQSYLDSRKGRQ
ncbi:MAG: Holliday junction resolvase RuvX [Acidobacteria bacterium]|nr:MAG: Holliday junction resolvase RuvX [Acidobacteriota bacterium]